MAVRDVAKDNLDAARQLEANEHIRLEHQDLAGIDFARIELDTQELEVELTRADADIAVALAACSATLFADCNLDGLDVATLDAAAVLPGELADAARAVLDRPEHQAQRLEASALGQDAVLADHRKIPDPTIGLSYTYDNYNYSGSLPHSISLSVGIPLPFFDRGDHDAAAARANAASLEAQDDATLRTELGAVEGLRKQLLAVKASLDRYERESLPRSNAIVEQTRKAFDLGQTGLAELLLDERAYRDLVHKILDTRFELFNVRAQLRRALGLDDLAARGGRGRDERRADSVRARRQRARQPHGVVGVSLVIAIALGDPRAHVPAARAGPRAAGSGDDGRLRLVTLAPNAPQWAVIETRNPDPPQPNWTEPIPARVVFDESRTVAARHAARRPGQRGRMSRGGQPVKAGRSAVRGVERRASPTWWPTASAPRSSATPRRRACAGPRTRSTPRCCPSKELVAAQAGAGERRARAAARQAEALVAQGRQRRRAPRSRSPRRATAWWSSAWSQSARRCRPTTAR